MKREALSAVVDRHIGKIEKHSNQLPGSFEQEDIHDNLTVIFPHSIIEPGI